MIRSIHGNSLFFENSVGMQLTEKGRSLVSGMITPDMTCKVCGAKIILMSATDGDYIGCTEKLFEHDTGFIIEPEYSGIEGAGTWKNPVIIKQDKR